MTKGAENSDKKLMTLQEHFKELRNRIIFCALFFVITFSVGYYFAQEIYEFLLRPFFMVSKSNYERKLIFTSPQEGFVTYVKTSLYTALFFSFPIFATQFYFFLSPALFKNEKKNILLILFFCPFLFLIGMLFAYYFILPLSFEFFLSFEYQGSASSLPIYLETRISEYLSLVLKLLFGFGVAFQLPILLLFLIKINFLSVDDLRSKRKYWIVIIFVIAAILTPPDVLSQISLAIPMLLLFEIAILVGEKLLTKNKKRYGY